MIRFGLYGRVSTEDGQQDAQASLNWQRRRAESCIAGHGEIAATFFDIGQSRSLPWKRRPEATKLLAAMRDPGRGFDAVVIGEPQRAFWGDQYGQIFPLFVHYGVGLWVPDVGGEIDPDSEAHDMLMSMFASMSKGERRRIQTRVTTAMEAQTAVEGRFLGGRPPYGYRLADAGPHPKRDRGRINKLVPDADAAPVVRRIFSMYVDDRMGLGSIAQTLTDEGIASPSAHDPGRNRHRAGSGAAWAKSAIRAILTNPRYTGYQVWGKARGREQLIDVDDVAAGYAKRSRIVDQSEWVISTEIAHEPIVDSETFAAAQAEIKKGRARPTEQRRRSKRTYVLRGRVICETCGRRMEADTSNGRARYRCRLSGADYARNERLERSHPKSAAVSEERLVIAIADALTGYFDDADRIESILRGATDPDPAALQRAERAKAKIDDANIKLARYRALLDTGTDPALVGPWIAEVSAELASAERELAASVPETDGVTDDEITELVRFVTETGEVFRSAVADLSHVDPTALRAVLDALSLGVLFTPGERRAVLAPVGGKGGVGGGT